MIEVVNSITSFMEKADESDIAGLQAYTITSLDNNPNSDIDQYKVMNVSEHPSRQQEVAPRLNVLPSSLSHRSFR